MLNMTFTATRCQIGPLASLSKCVINSINFVRKKKMKCIRTLITLQSKKRIFCPPLAGLFIHGDVFYVSHFFYVMDPKGTLFVVLKVNKQTNKQNFLFPEIVTWLSDNQML